MCSGILLRGTTFICLGKELAFFTKYVDQRKWIGEGIGEAGIYISHIFIDMWWELTFIAIVSIVSFLGRIWPLLSL